MERLIIAGVALFAVGLVVVLAINAASRQPLQTDLASVTDNSQPVPNQGQGHISAGTPSPSYNSNPPTSGPHNASASPTGVYTSSVPDELLVHNLEHGHVWLSYRDANDQEAINLLSDIQRRNPGYVIVTHRPQNDKRIAAAAWTRLLTLNELSTEQLQAFVLRYQARAPENVPG